MAHRHDRRNEPLMNMKSFDPPQVAVDMAMLAIPFGQQVRLIEIISNIIVTVFPFTVVTVL